MCLLFIWASGLDVSIAISLLSKLIMTACIKWIDRATKIEIGLLILIRSDMSQTVSLVVCVCPIYSLSQMDTIIVSWHWKLQLIVLLPI